MRIGNRSTINSDNLHIKNRYIHIYQNSLRSLYIYGSMNVLTATAKKMNANCLASLSEKLKPSRSSELISSSSSNYKRF